MVLRNITGQAKQALNKIKGSIIEECPPELYACEICSKLECNDEEWLTCEKRLKAAEFMKELAHNRAAAASGEFECRHDAETTGKRTDRAGSDSENEDA